jgi:hypothetical protein
VSPARGNLGPAGKVQPGTVAEHARQLYRKLRVSLPPLISYLFDFISERYEITKVHVNDTLENINPDRLIIMDRYISKTDHRF